MGVLDVLRDSAAVITAAVVGKKLGGAVAPTAAAIYIGIRQRHLSNLTHEAIHQKLVPSRNGNRVLGHVIATALGEPFTPYRKTHWIHHAQLGGMDDPMLQSYLSRNATTERADKKTFVRDVILKAIIWKLPMAQFNTFRPGSPGESRQAAIARMSVWGTAFAIAVVTRNARAFLWYWFVPLMFVRPAVTWLTDLGNHAGVIETSDPFRQTRGWSSHILTRHILGGHWDDMYHPVHHVCPNIPWRKLPRARELLAADLEKWKEVPWCSGYFFRRRSTPDTPCVLEDIVERLRVVDIRQSA